MRTKGDFLFADGNLGDALLEYQMQTSRQVDSMPEDRFKRLSDAEVAAEILSNFKVAPLAIQEDAKTMTRSETVMDVTDYGRRIRVNAIRVVVSIPFVGDAGFWKLKPSSWRSTFPTGEIRAQDDFSGFLNIVIEKPADEKPEAIKQDLDEQLDDIRFYIGNQRQQIDSEIPQIAQRVGQAITARRQRLARHDGLAGILGIPEKPYSPPAALPRPAAKSETKPTPLPPREWDVFISHASEDKDNIARPLANALQATGLRVWFDEFTLTVGDNLRQSIDHGLENSRFGVVIISPHFLGKHWPQKELDGFTALEVDGRKVILPVWHNVDRQTVTQFSPPLAIRLAANSSKGIPAVVAALRAAIDRG